MAALPEEFRVLEEDFVDCKMAINNHINDILHGSAAGAAATAAQRAQAQVVEAQRCMKLMSIEVRGKPPSLRKAMQAKVNLYREELQGLLRDLERAQLMAREMKAGSGQKGFESQYERLNENTNRLMRSSKTLENSHRLVAETEEIGISVLDTLAQQRESLLSAHDKVRETSAMTSEARRVLQRMTRRIITNTIVLYTTIFVLVAAICFVIYHDFIKVSASMPFAGWI